MTLFLQQLVHKYPTLHSLLTPSSHYVLHLLSSYPPPLPNGSSFYFHAPSSTLESSPPRTSLSTFSDFANSTVSPFEDYYYAEDSSLRDTKDCIPDMVPAYLHCSPTAFLSSSPLTQLTSYPVINIEIQWLITPSIYLLNLMEDLQKMATKNNLLFAHVQYSFIHAFQSPISPFLNYHSIQLKNKYKPYFLLIFHYQFIPLTLYKLYHQTISFNPNQIEGFMNKSNSLFFQVHNSHYVEDYSSWNHDIDESIDDEFTIDFVNQRKEGDSNSVCFWLFVL